jgi:hypothetical protein
MTAPVKAGAFLSFVGRFDTFVEKKRTFVDESCKL